MVAFAMPVDADQLRLRHEFLEMPGLTLTSAQVARMLAIRQPHAKAILESLEDDGFLIETAAGMYRLAEPHMA